MIAIFVHRRGVTERAAAVDPAWLVPDSGVTVWVDLAGATAEESRLLGDPFGFHELAVEDALSASHHPKVEAYEGYIYLILHGIDFQASRHRFTTHDVDFFLGPTWLVTVHDGTSRSIERVGELCGRHAHVMAEGSTALLHRIVDTMVDHYLPEVRKLETKVEELERRVFASADHRTSHALLQLKKDVASLRRVVLPERDVVSRLARREFPLVSEALAYRFRDVYDQLVRLSDEAFSLQDRLTGIMDAHLTIVSNRLNEVMKILTIIATVFMPLSVITGLYGMNVDLPTLPGGAAVQFWWVIGVMASLSGGMLWAFRRRGWL